MQERARTVARVTMSLRGPKPATPATNGRGSLFSDAIRLRPGATVPRVAMSTNRNSFKEPVFVPQHIAPTSNDYNIDKLVGAAQTGLRTGEAIACCKVHKPKMTKILHREEEEEEPCAAPMDSAHAAEEAVYHAASAAHRVTSVSTGLRPRSGPEAEVDTQGVVQVLGGIKQWWKATESERVPLPEGREVEPESRTMIKAHVAKQGVDLRHTDIATFAWVETMAVAMEHLDAMAGTDWEDEVDIGAPAWWERKKKQAKDVYAKGKVMADEAAAKAKKMAAKGKDATDNAKKALAKGKDNASGALKRAKEAAAAAADRASEAKTRAKEAAAAAAGRASEAKSKVENSKAGKLVGKAKAVVSKFAKNKWERFTNEDRITKMERYDYTVYSSQPLRKVVLDKKSTSLTFGCDPASDKDALHDPHTRCVKEDPLFYGMVASLEKSVVSNEQGDQAFVLDAKDRLDILGSDKYRDVLVIRQPAEGEDPLTEMTKDGYSAGTYYGGSPYEVLDRIRAQNAVQMHAVPSATDSSQLVYPPDGKPNGPHPLCLGHSMMVPVSSLGPPKPYRQNASALPEPSMGEADDPLSLLHACVSSDWLKKIEAELVASPLRKDFTIMLASEGAEHTPFIIPMSSKYATPEDLSKKNAELYKQAFPNTETNRPNASMRPVSALLVVPLEAHILRDSGALKRTDEGGIDMEWQRLYPWEIVPSYTKKSENNPVDPVSDARKAINEKIKLGETPTSDKMADMGYATSSEPTSIKGNPHAPVKFTQSDVDFQSRFQVAVFALGLAPACDAGGNHSACEHALDDAGSGDMLMIGTHPLLFGKQHDGVEYTGFEGPDQVFVSNGNGAPLTNALPIALEGVHFDTRFVWSSMKLLQRSWSKATNPRVSKPTLARFRKLVGMSKEQWQNADVKFNLSGWAKKGAGRSASFQRRGASKDDEMFGRALEELGLTNVLTGTHVDLHELSKQELSMALAHAGIDLDAPEHD